MSLARLGGGLLAALLLLPCTGMAAAPNTMEEAESFLERLDFKDGRIEIPLAKATLRLGSQFRYLENHDARRVLEELWGNPPDDTVLGLVVPTKVSLIGEHSWAVVVTYNEDGYISDGDAADINYDQIMAEMKAQDVQSNKERRRQGYEGLELIGWAEPPRYDQASKKLYWARELKAEGADGNTVNYDIRVLGRRGYLSLNAVATMDDLPIVRQGMRELLPMAEFSKGARYADYDASTDKLATYGLAALVGGGLAAKAGLFSKLGLFLIKAWKLLALAILTIVAMIGKLFTRKNSTVVD